MAILKNGHVQLQTSGACGCPSCATSGPTTPRRAAGLTPQQVADMAREELDRRRGNEAPSLSDYLKQDGKTDAQVEAERLNDYFKAPDSGF